MKRFTLIMLIMGVSTIGFSQDTTKAIIESPVIKKATDSLKTIIEPVLIDISEEEVMDNPGVEIKKVIDTAKVEVIADTAGIELEKITDTPEIMDKPVIIEETGEDILVIPDVEEEVKPVETMSKPEEPESALDPGKVIIVSEKVGEEIDSKEKNKYNLFSDYTKKEFQSAKFLEMQDGSIILRTVIKGGSIKDTPFTKEEFSSVKNSIDPAYDKSSAGKKEDIQKETVKEVAGDKEKPKKEKVDVVDVVYKIAGVALVILAIILFPF